MPRLIDADEVIKKLRNIVVPSDLFGMSVGQGIHEAIKEMLDAPTIEAETVRKGEPQPYTVQEIGDGGRIVAEYQGGWSCPFCGEPDVKNYCPNCGAKMDGKE